MRSRILVLVAVLLCTAGMVLPQAQNRVSDGQREGQVIVNVVQKLVFVSVTDRRGKLITTLKKEDFKVYEDERLQKIDNFTSETNLPLSIAMLIDSSQSVIDKLKFEQQAAIEFFFSTVQRKKDRAMLVSFDTTPLEVVPFTDQPDVLAEGVRKIKAGGGTAVFDAVYAAVKSKLALEAGERRKLIVLISDGQDVASRWSLTEALDLVQKNDVAIYAISTNKTSGTRTQSSDGVNGDKVIRTLVEETGGKAYFPLKLDDLGQEFQKIGDELRSQYVISYTPSNPSLDGTYRKIRVELADKRYTSITRKGYYADKAGN